MPALSALRVEALRTLAQQLRYSPKTAVQRVAAQAEKLVEAVEPEGTYPEDWLIRFLTGHRVEIRSPALLVGQALLGELSAFVELLTEQARCTAKDAPPGSVTQEELAKRWGVSVRTVQRWRRRGLVARRVRLERGGSAIVFSPQAVERFEALRSDVLARARARTRLDEPTRSALLRQAQQLRSQERASLTSVVHALAQTPQGQGLSRSALHRLAASTEPPKLRWTRQRKAQAHRLLAQGAAPRSVAVALGASPEAVLRADRLWRLSRLKRLLARDPSSASTAQTAAAQRSVTREEALAELNTAIEAAQQLAPVFPPPAPTLGRFAELQALTPWPADAAKEAALVRAHGLLVQGALRGAQAISPWQPAERELDACETALRLAWMLRCELVQSQTPVIWRALVAQGQVLERTQRQAAALHLRAMRAVCAATARATLQRGGRLAAPVGLALGRALARMAQTTPDRPAGRARRAGALEAQLSDWRLRACAWAPALAPRAWLREGFEALGGQEREVVAGRFGLSGMQPATLSQRAEALGTSIAALRRRERAALARAWRAAGGS